MVQVRGMVAMVKQTRPLFFSRSLEGGGWVAQVCGARGFGTQGTYTLPSTTGAPAGSLCHRNAFWFNPKCNLPLLSPFHLIHRELVDLAIAGAEVSASTCTALAAL